MPASTGGRLTADTLMGGPAAVDARRRAVVATTRCCAGTRGTTTTYRVTPAGTLALVHVEEWKETAAGRRRTTVTYPAAPRAP